MCKGRARFISQRPKPKSTASVTGERICDREAKQSELLLKDRGEGRCESFAGMWRWACAFVATPLAPAVPLPLSLAERDSFPVDLSTRARFCALDMVSLLVVELFVCEMDPGQELPLQDVKRHRPGLTRCSSFVPQLSLLTAQRNKGDRTAQRCNRPSPRSSASLQPSMRASSPSQLRTSVNPNPVLSPDAAQSGPRLLAWVIYRFEYWIL